MHRQSAIACVSEIRPGRYPRQSPLGMFELVAGALISEWSLGPDMPTVIDGLLACPAGMAAGKGADVFVHEILSDTLRLRPRYAEIINAGGATYGLMVKRAAWAIES